MGLEKFKKFVKRDFIAFDATGGAVLAFEVRNVFVKVVGFYFLGREGAVASPAPIQKQS